METIWFCLFWIGLATFAVFGGTDIGVGILHFLVGRTEGERGQVIQAIHQVWKPNQVWLVAGGGMMFVAFPKLLAESLSGFYLAIMLVLWLLVGRGTGIELRDRVADGMWHKFWDALFCVSSLLLAVCLGAALGNFVRGVPRDAGKGVFFEALWTNFLLGANTGILDWFTVMVGVTAVIAVMYQGALWLNRFTDGAVQERAARLARGLWVALVAALVVCVAVSYFVQPQVRINVAAQWWGLVLPVAALGAAVASRCCLQRKGVCVAGVYCFRGGVVCGDGMRGVRALSVCAGGAGSGAGAYGFCGGGAAGESGIGAVVVGAGVSDCGGVFCVCVFEDAGEIFAGSEE